MTSVACGDGVNDQSENNWKVIIIDRNIWGEHYATKKWICGEIER
jgi:hypothetical protein